MKPVVTWNAKKPSIQRMIKTAAMIPSTSNPRVAEREPIRNRALSSSTVVRAGREFCPVVDTLIELSAESFSWSIEKLRRPSTAVGAN